jgi:hypothetical protein
VLDVNDARSQPNCEWREYRKVKQRIIVLLAGWMPFGLLIGGLLPVILRTYTPTYVLATGYMLWVCFAWLQYASYPCPNCGKSLRCAQLYRKTCPKCGTAINPTVSKT